MDAIKRPPRNRLRRAAGGAPLGGSGEAASAGVSFAGVGGHVVDDLDLAADDVGLGGVDYALDKHNEKLVTPDMKAKVDAAKADIISGKIKVVDYMTAGKC